MTAKVTQKLDLLTKKQDKTATTTPVKQPAINAGQISDGLLQTMKIMTAIPPSSDTVPNCIVLSQLYPSFHGDGTTHDETLYHVNLHAGISKNLTARGLDFKMGDDEQVRAFNDLAHLMGFKTGFRMPISSGQLRINGKDFSWQRDERAFIDACKWGILD